MVKSKAKKGGPRPGAGRPVASTTLETQKQREMLVKLLKPRIKRIFEALAEKAEQGDVMAAKELFDRAWGKATQTVEVEDKRTLIV